QHIADHFETNPFVCGLTFSGNPIGCATALATMKVYEEENLVENSRIMGDRMAEKLQEMKAKHPSVGDVRSLGLYGLIECVKNRETREPLAPWNAKPHEMVVMGKMAARLRELGLHGLMRWNWVFMSPPLCINEEQLEEGFAIIDDALKIADEAYEG
ncbi:MAG: aminotransferase class III-fold pyridoxal phosphate-dependent enzyme, partial [Moorea sp. SIO4E2]